MSTSARHSFGPHSTALEVIDGIDLRGRAAIVTGASSGIGVETARALAHAGAEVSLAVRDVAAGEVAAIDIRTSTGNPAVAVRQLDLADLRSVDEFTAHWQGPLHILVNNAGIMHTPEQRTSEGWEMQFAVNHLGHFALTTGLYRALAATRGSRVVNVSSSGHGSSGIRFDDLHFTRDPYDPSLAYGQAKTANSLFALEINRRWAEAGILAGALMPGGIWTKLQRSWDPALLADMKRRYKTKTPQQGAATSIFVATRAPLGPHKPVYYEDCHPSKVVPQILDGEHGVMPHAIDPEVAGRLWDVSESLLEDARRHRRQ